MEPGQSAGEPPVREGEDGDERVVGGAVGAEQVVPAGGRRGGPARERRGEDGLALLVPDLQLSRLGGGEQERGGSRSRRGKG